MQTNQRLQITQKLFPLLDVLRYDEHVKGWPVVHKQLPMTVKNHSSKGGDILKVYAIVLRLDSIGRAASDLKPPQSHD
jgi:hypothetical protein